MKIIAIVGSRRRDTDADKEACRKSFLSVYNKGDALVSGGCPRGGDRFCEEFSIEYNIPIKIHKAEWDKYGKGAGFVRNTYIAEDADIVIACVHEDRYGGTEDMIKKAEKLGKTIILVPQLSCNQQVREDIRNNALSELDAIL